MIMVHVLKVFEGQTSWGLVFGLAQESQPFEERDLCECGAEHTQLFISAPLARTQSERLTVSQ